MIKQLMRLCEERSLTNYILWNLIEG